MRKSVVIAIVLSLAVFASAFAGQKTVQVTAEKFYADWEENALSAEEKYISRYAEDNTAEVIVIMTGTVDQVTTTTGWFGGPVYYVILRPGVPVEYSFDYPFDVELKKKVKALRRGDRVSLHCQVTGPAFVDSSSRFNVIAKSLDAAVKKQQR